MPLVRVEVRNEYGLGVEELYKKGVENEDPKAVLDGVALSGLVGLLRQLGDLAQFSAEVFHGLQEQVASTSSRSRKLVNRVQQIEASLPSLEKAILSQTDHLRFAYTPGTEWHASIREERNHFIFDDLPQFIMDSYEECREPPRLQLLDRFDTGGPGTCLKRYTDPTFFRRASSCSEDSNNEKSQQDKKAKKIKKRRSWQRNGHFHISSSILNGNGRMQISATGPGQSSMSHTGSNFDMSFKSDLGDQSDPQGSKDGTDIVEAVSRSSISTQPDATKDKGLSSSVRKAEVNTNGSMYPNELTAVTYGKPCIYEVEATFPHASSATWDEKLEMLERMDDNHDIEVSQQVTLTNSFLPDQEFQLVHSKVINQDNDLSNQGSNPRSRADGWHLCTTGDGNLLEQTELHSELHEVPHFLKPNFDLLGHHLKPVYRKPESQLVELSKGGIPPEPTINGNVIYEPVLKSLGTGQAQYFLEADVGVSEEELETNRIELGSATDACIEGGSNVRAIEWTQKEAERITADHVNQEDVQAIEWNHLDFEIVHSDHISEGDAFSEGRSSVNAIGWRHMELKTIDADHVNLEDDAISEGKASSEGGNNVKLIKWNELELETQIDENEGQVQVIEWNQNDDIDSGTENFVDALNTIDSESESDFEPEMKKKAQPTTCKDEIGENEVNGILTDLGSHLKPEHQPLLTSFIDRKMEEVRETALEDEEAANEVSDQTAEKLSHVEPEQHLSTSYHHEEENLEELEKVTDYVPTPNLEAPDLSQSSRNELISTADQKLDLVSEIASLSNVHRDLVFCTNEPEKEIEPAVSEITKSGYEGPGDERISSAPQVFEEISVGSSTTYPHAFWTNGMLLGLQPSKPTVVSMPNSVDSGPTSKIDKVGQHRLDAMHKNDDLKGTAASSANEPENCNRLGINEPENRNKLGINGQDVGFSKNLSNQRLKMANKKSSGCDNGNLHDHSTFLDLSNCNAAPLESKVFIDTNVKNTSSEASAASEDRSSLLSLLSRGLLKNSLRRSGSLGYGESLKSLSPEKSNHSDNRYQYAIMPEPKGKLSSPVHSPPPSPPLEHMKISFQPVDGFDTSRLKLKYPEGVDHVENTLDAFPSFQLVPESSSLQHDIGSDSDDDTFCRSHAYMSDESHSHLSDSDSEQWESRDSTESNDPTLYNGLHQISSAESAANSPRHEADHNNMHLSSGSSFGVTISDAKNPVAYQDMKLCLKPEIDSSHVQQPTHEPPPLPPLQWRVSKPQFDEAEGNQGWGSYTLSQPFVPKRPDSAIANPVLVESTKLINTVQESSTIATPKKQVEEENFGQEQTYWTDKGRKMDDGGDFLHQIRTKSFNLKRTEPTRSTYAPPPTTSNKITAILQKASAIRQAVGSDDGEDDSWSDT